MKKITLATTLSLFLFLLTIATFESLLFGIGDAFCADDFQISELMVNAPDLAQEIVLPDSKPEVARSGCCSWHGGVCDCIGGRVVCCDGTFSPSCTCYHDGNKDMPNVKE